MEEIQDFTSNKARISTRKEIIEKKKAIDQLIKSACEIKDPLVHFPGFRLYNQRGLSLCLEAGHGVKLSRSLKQYMQKLLKVNMERYYGAEWPAEEKVKCREIVAPEARHIFVYDVPISSSNDEERVMNVRKGNIVGFAHYRFTLEEELPVLYVYELQLETCIRGKGLGKFLMQLMELIARKTCMAAVILTVQKTNLSAISFYTSKLGYSVSATSPSKFDPLIGVQVNYEILCKTLDQEAKKQGGGITSRVLFSKA